MSRTKILFVCNPNNPTGTYWDRDTMTGFLDEVDNRAIVVIDEAYCEYVENKDFPDSMTLMGKYPNVVAFRTFSKMYALASLRIGYLCSTPEIVGMIRRTHVVYSVNTLAQKAAFAALSNDGSFIRETRKMVGDAKALLCSLFDELGLIYICNQGNYLMVKVPISDTLMYRKLMTKGIMVRTMTGFRFPNWIRISLVQKSVMEEFCRTFGRIIKEIPFTKDTRLTGHCPVSPKENKNMDRNLLMKRLKAVRTDINPDQDVEIALFEPNDALGVSLCYYEIYGNSFPIDHVYDPEAVVRRNATDDQYTIVARTSRGEIVGLVGIFRHAPNPGVYEIGQLMLLKAFRKGRLSVDIAQQTINLSLTLNLPVVFAEIVCNHPVAQRLAFEQGLHATGLELECMPAAAYSKEKSGNRNISLLLTFDIRKDNKHNVYLPQAYASFIRKMYDNLGLMRGTAKGSEFTGTTEWDEFLLPKAGFSRITIQRAGRDFQDIVEKAESNAGENGLVQVYINIGDETASRAIDYLRDNGYFLGGLLPLWFGTDGLIMQKLPQPPAWDELHIFGQAAENLAADIRQDHERANPSH